jgi:hypothetical protein
MEIGCWSILISSVGVLATAGLAWYLHKRTTNMTKEMREFLITLIVNASSDPRTLERLLKDHKNTGEGRGTVEKIPETDSYRIAWHPQNVSTFGIPSSEAFGTPGIIKGPPKPKKDEPK